MIMGPIGTMVMAVLMFLSSGGLDANSPQSGGAVLYGNQHSDPVILDGEIRITSDTALIRGGGDDATYAVVDHLGSGRVVNSGTGDPGYNEYDPHGRVIYGQATPPVYTGKVFEEPIGTYDFLAREYDPNLGRFLGVDPVGASNSPYGYASNDPINQLDPDGRATTYFFLYSKLEGMLRQPNGHVAPRYAEVEHLARVVHRLPLISVTLETTPRTPFYRNFGPGIHHLTVVAPGAPGTISVESFSGPVRNLTGSGFASFLQLRMRQQFGDTGNYLRSISLLNCQSGCPGRSTDGQLEPSFAEDFARVARSHFPRLQRIVASPYDVGVTELLLAGHESEMGLVVRSNAERESVIQRIDPESFFGGDLPRRLFEQPVPSMFFGIHELVSSPGSRGGERLEFSGDSNRVHGFMDSHRNEFTRPVLQEITIDAPVPD